MTIPADYDQARGMLDDVMKKTVALDLRFPGEWPIHSILKQLDFLKKKASPEKMTLEEFEGLNFGFLAMRFIYDFDDTLARDLSDLNTFIKMRFDNTFKNG